MTSVSEVDWQMAPEEIELAAQRQRVGEVAVVGDGEAAGVEIGEQRLHVAQDGVAGGGVAVVAEGDVALQAADDVGLVEVVADQAQPALGMEVAAVVGDDAGRLLAAMLQGVQAERGQRRRVLVAEHAEDAAFLAQAVVVGAEAGARHRRVTRIERKFMAASQVHDRQRYPGAAVVLRHPFPRGTRDIGQVAPRLPRGAVNRLL